MTLDEARRILGLSADEDPTAHFDEFTAARNRIADLVRTAPNDTIALRYQDGLVEFERALAALREEINKEDPEIAKRNAWMAAARAPDPQSPRRTRSRPRGNPWRNPRTKRRMPTSFPNPSRGTVPACSRFF